VVPRRSVLIAIILSAAGSAACLLTTSLDGFSEPAGAPATDGAAETDAGAAVPPEDGSGPSDAAAREGDAPAPASAYAKAVLDDAPLAYWRLGERGGQAVRDERGAAAGSWLRPTGYELGAPGALSGDGDTAVHFTGSGGLVQMGDQLDFAGTAPFTVELWYRAGPPANRYSRLVSKELGGASPLGWNVEVDPTGALNFGLYTSGGELRIHAGVPAADVYHHIVAVRDVSELRLYVDGFARPPRAVSLTLPDTTAPLVLGGASYDGDYFHGILDEVAIYGRALLQEQVAAHYAAAGR
jgi:hypothetical protein